VSPMKLRNMVAVTKPIGPFRNFIKT